MKNIHKHLYKMIIKTIIIYTIICSYLITASTLETNLNQKYDIKKIKLTYNIKNIFFDLNNNIYITNNKDIYMYKNMTIKHIIHIKQLKKNEIKKITANNKIIIIYTKNKKLIAIDKSKKCIKWIKYLNDKIFFNLVIDKKKLYIDSNGMTLVALDNDNGNIIWKFYDITTKNCYINGKILQTKKYIHYIYSDDKIITLNKNTGKKITKYNYLHTTDKHDLSKIKNIFDINIYNNIIYMSYDDGTIITTNPFNKNIMWFKKKIYTYITLMDDKIITANKNGQIFFLNKLNGNIIKKINELKEKNLFKPIILKNSIIINDNKGNVHFINKHTGNIIDIINIGTENIKYNIIDKLNESILILTNTKLIKIKKI